MAPSNNPYACTLDAPTQKKALDELYEDPKNRQGAIDTFRDWIKQQKHIKCPTGDLFLLGFLRAKHFSQLESRQSLEFLMKQRDQLSYALKNLDPAAADITDILKTPPILLLPGRDREGRRVIILKPGAFDMGNKKKFLAFFRLFAITCYYNYFCDEMTQVHGTIYIVDMTGHTMANEMKVSLEDKRKFTVIMQKTFPARVKGFHMYNSGIMLEFIMGLIGRLFTDKLKKRMKFHNHGLESLYKDIPMEILPEDYLPDEYTGPSAGTLEQLTGRMKTELCQPEIRAMIKDLSSDAYSIKMKDKDTDVPVASFRKLNVD